MIKLTKNIVQFRNGFVNVPPAQKTTDNYLLSMSVASELMQFGFVLDQGAISLLAHSTKTEITKFHTEVIDYLKDITGGKRNYTPFWKGFPDDVMEKSEAELWSHQIAHYISNGRYEPSEWTITRKTAFEQPKYTIITSGDDTMYQKIFTDLVSVNQSLTPDDLNTVKFFVSSGEMLIFPPSIPFKENLCTLAGMGLDVPVKTVTDVLRIAVHMSGGDISLPAVPIKYVRASRWSSSKIPNPDREKFKFKKFTRAERKYLLGLLEKTNCDVKEMVLRKNRWIRLVHPLHPGEYKAKFPKAFDAINKLRNDKVKSWYGDVDEAFRKSFIDGVTKLSERAGEFARNMDNMIRNADGDKKMIKHVLDTFATISGKVSNKVLYEMYAHFENRQDPKTNRTIMIKGARKRTTLPDLPGINRKYIDSIQSTVKEALHRNFGLMPSLGKVYLDEELKKMPLPTNMRSLNSTFRPVMRGQRVKIDVDPSKVIRAYVHWYDERGNEDIDLTATFIGDSKHETVGWNGRHNPQYGVYSGDVRFRKGACAEYIDIAVDKAIKNGFTHVVIDANNFQQRGFDTVKECVFGYQERETPSANQNWKPDTIANSVKLQSTSSTTLVTVIDLVNMEYIFLDLDRSGIPVSSVHANDLLKTIAPYLNPPAFSVYDLLEIHGNARGELVEAKKEADVVYTMESFPTYIEILKIMGI